MTLALPHFAPLDYLLLIMVSVMSTLIAYLHHPKWKALILALPIPFTLVVLAVGRPIDASNIVGLNLLLAYTHGVRFFYQKLRLPIVLAILLSATGYVLLGKWLVSRVPHTPEMFWAALVGTMLLALLLQWLLPERDEPGHRSQLAIAIKFPLVVLIVCFVVVIKNELQGFTSMFPMVGLIAAYESRHSLWTVCRQIQMAMLSLGLMIVTIYLLQGPLGIGWALAAGWVVMLSVLLPLTRDIWRAPEVAREPAPLGASSS